MERSERRVVVLQHTEYEHAGLVGRALAQTDFEIEYVRVDLGESPPPCDLVQGILSLGGPMSVHDEDAHPWIPLECAYLGEALGLRIPVVGICLGAQLIAKTLGSAVTKNASTEIGWHTVKLTNQGMADPVLSPLSLSPFVYHWHSETFAIPKGAVHLGISDACHNQAFAIGDGTPHAYGFQFHPEVDQAIAAEWLDHEECHAEIERALRGSAPKHIQTPEMQRAFSQQTASEQLSRAIAAFLTRETRSGHRPQRTR